MTGLAVSLAQEQDDLELARKTLRALRSAAQCIEKLATVSADGCGGLLASSLLRLTEATTAAEGLVKAIAEQELAVDGIFEAGRAYEREQAAVARRQLLRPVS